ncbi:hypothetical protein DH2020_000435 [Rehmannia glutinosa]|uniref:Senescence regulator n=1 Tax=Rehmannia glutinosa TaxID=99300 RepID=A0ABR0XWT1_REHGL
MGLTNLLLIKSDMRDSREIGLEKFLPLRSFTKPQPPQAERVRFHPQSAPVNIPVMPAALQRRARELEDAVSDGEEEDKNSVKLPPHEVVAARHSPMLACSVMEGAGRTLKGRDLRQVRNAIWRKTGFID